MPRILRGVIVGVLFAAAPAVKADTPKPWPPRWQGELVKLLPWCNLQAGQPRMGDWCNVQGDAFPLIAGFDNSRLLFAGSAVWVGTLFPSGVVCIATSEYGVFTCGSPAGYGSMGELLPEGRQ